MIRKEKGEEGSFGRDHNQITLSRLKEDLEGKEKKEEGREEEIVGEERRICEFCTLFCFDQVDLNLDFVDTLNLNAIGV